MSVAVAGSAGSATTAVQCARSAAGVSTEVGFQSVANAMEEVSMKLYGPTHLLASRPESSRASTVVWLRAVYDGRGQHDYHAGQLQTGGGQGEATVSSWHVPVVVEVSGVCTCDSHAAGGGGVITGSEHSRSPGHTCVGRSSRLGIRMPLILSVACTDRAERDGTSSRDEGDGATRCHTTVAGVDRIVVVPATDEA